MMPTSATGSNHAPARPCRERGFTLVEIMVVLTIIGLASAAVVLMMPDPRGNLRMEGERFAARVQAAQDMAVLETHDVALQIDQRGYSFETRAGGEWTIINAKPLEPVNWAQGTEVLAGPAGHIRIVFDTTGLSEPLNLELHRTNASVRVNIAADGKIHVAS